MHREKTKISSKFGWCTPVSMTCERKHKYVALSIQKLTCYFVRNGRITRPQSFRPFVRSFVARSWCYRRPLMKKKSQKIQFLPELSILSLSDVLVILTPNNGSLLITSVHNSRSTRTLRYGLEQLFRGVLKLGCCRLYTSVRTPGNKCKQQIKHSKSSKMFMLETHFYNKKETIASAIFGLHGAERMFNIF